MEIGRIDCEAVRFVAISQKKSPSFSNTCRSDFLGSPGKKKCVVS